MMSLGWVGVKYAAWSGCAPVHWCTVGGSGMEPTRRADPSYCGEMAAAAGAGRWGAAWRAGFTTDPGCDSGDTRPSWWEMRVCRFNRSRLVKAAPQKQINGFSLVSGMPGSAILHVFVPRHSDSNGTYGCAHGAPNAPSVETLGRNVYRSGPLRRGPSSGEMGMPWVLGVLGERKEVGLRGKSWSLGSAESASPRGDPNSSTAPLLIGCLR